MKVLERYTGATSPTYSSGMTESYHVPREDEVISNSIDNDNVDLKLSILDLYDCCSKGNWDGEGAKAITSAAWRGALRLIDMFPTSFPKPEITASPDGSIVFEWYRQKDYILAVTISDEYKLHYNALFGQAEAYGTELSQDSLPKELLDNLARLYND
jgi:hypothetical protein